MSELVFEVIQEADGGFCAECLSDTIVTEGNTWEELRRNVQEVVRAFYFDDPGKLPATIRLSVSQSTHCEAKGWRSERPVRVPGLQWASGGNKQERERREGQTAEAAVLIQGS